jgi:hypothetical protein
MSLGVGATAEVVGGLSVAFPPERDTAGIAS